MINSVPTPESEESLDGFLRRLAEAEFWPDVSDYLTGLGLRYGRPLIEGIKQAEAKIGLAAGTLAVIAPSHASNRPARRWRFERHHSAPVCAECISSGSTHHQSWRHAFVTCCVEHELRLIDQCPMCLETFLPGRGGYDSCHCGCPLDGLETTPANQTEIAIAALISGKMHPSRSLLASALAFRTPVDIGEFIFLLASGGVETATGKQGKTPLPRTVEETLNFLSAASQLLCQWPTAFEAEVARRLQEGELSATSAPAQLGRWYQRLLSFDSEAYSDFHETLAEVVCQKFDGAYVGGIDVAHDKRQWVSAAEVGRVLHVRAERIVEAVAKGTISGRQDTSGFGHRHTIIDKTTVEQIQANRCRFVGKSDIREFLGVSRKQLDLFIDAGGLKPCSPKFTPPLVDGPFDIEALREFVLKLGHSARGPDGETVVFSDLNLRFTTDKAGLTAVFQQMVDGRLKAVTGSCDGCLSDFRFIRAEVDSIICEVRRGPGLTIQHISKMTGWKEQCIAGWCDQSLLKHETYDHAGRTGRIVRPEGLHRFQDKYVTLSSLSKQMGTSSRHLMSRLEEVGVKTVGSIQDGKAMRGHLVAQADVASAVTGIIRAANA